MTDHETLAQWCREQAKICSTRARMNWGLNNQFLAVEDGKAAERHTTIATLLTQAEADAAKARAFDAIAERDWFVSPRRARCPSIIAVGAILHGGPTYQQVRYNQFPDKPSALLEAVERAMGERA